MEREQEEPIEIDTIRNDNGDNMDIALDYATLIEPHPADPELVNALERIHEDVTSRKLERDIPIFFTWFPSRWNGMENVLVDIVVDTLKYQVRLLCKENCYGCQTNHPSQREHDVCLMIETSEQVERFQEEAWNRLETDVVYKRWMDVLGNEKQLDPRLTPPYVERCQQYFDRHDRRLLKQKLGERVRDKLFERIKARNGVRKRSSKTRRCIRWN